MLRWLCARTRRTPIIFLLVITVIVLFFGRISKLPYRSIFGRFYGFVTVKHLQDEEENSQSKSIFVPLNTDPEILCHVPKLDPFDPSILRFVEHFRSLTCAQQQQNMTYIDDDGYLRFNESDVTGYSFLQRANITDYTCTYKTFDRASGLNDDEMAYNVPKVLRKPVKLDEDFVAVECIYDNQSFYRNFHAHPASKPNRIFAEPTEDQLSVLLMYIDSISYSVLQRNLPATFNYTSDIMKMVYFQAFNKVGDNSFPNMIAAMTGKRAYSEQEEMMKELPGHVPKYDAWPFIWRMFAAKGYGTMFNEDMPNWGLFHYLGQGFTKKSFDYYYHIFWRAIFEQPLANSSRYCFGNEPKPRIFLDIAKRHLRMTSTTLQFMYNFYIDQSHSYVNEVERMDDELVAFWRDMFENGYLNKTVVIFASDHGHRFSGIRSTLVVLFEGLLEERLPFFGIWFPDWFQERHPHIVENMRYNSKLLAATFDIHETLKDVLDVNYEGQQRPLHKRGLSVFYPLPKNRTCRDAGIPDHYCTCIIEKDLDPNVPFFKQGVSALIAHLNGLLVSYTSTCIPIALSKIDYIRQIDFDEKVKQGVKNYDSARRLEAELRSASIISHSKSSKSTKKSYRFGILTQPLGAQFEAVLQAEAFNSTLTIWKVLGSVSRINAYSEQSYCVKDAELRKFCSCVKTSTK